MITIMLAAAAIQCPAVNGPAKINIDRVKDGDTFVGTCKDRFGFPEIFRLLDLDTPEKAPRAKCEAEALHAKKATEFAKDLAKRGGMTGVVVVPSKEKYGRYLASMTYTIDRKPVEWREALIDAGYAVAYDGGQKIDWCAKLNQFNLNLEGGK
jgi:endonuclease YncB( thermonuclease family)